MNKFVDTHSHIYLSQFNEDLDECMVRAADAGVDKIILPNIDSQTVPELLSLMEKYPNECKGLMGLHPTHVKDNYKDQLDVIFRELSSGKYIGVGEIGIDLYWDKTFLKEQIEAFTQQIKYAIEHNLPFVIHARDSFDEVFQALEKIGESKYNGILHAFTGNDQQAKQATDFGLLLGIGGIVTFKNSGLADVLVNVDLNHLVLETDSPYLAPTPHRGKRNESSYIPFIAAKIAEVKHLTIEEVADITSQNAKVLFKLSDNIGSN